jgi:hypothetical protein
MIIATFVILVIFTLFMAGKDASSYLLKDKEATGDITTKRIQRWHRDGAAIFAMFTGTLAFDFPCLWYWIVAQALLVRLAIFDIAFNYYSSLNLNYLGSTAFVDKIFVKIFGVNGAKEKSLAFLAAAIILTVFVLI